eukprot:1796432-Rhodomonas_salina.1
MRQRLESPQLLEETPQNSDATRASESLALRQRPRQLRPQPGVCFETACCVREEATVASQIEMGQRCAFPQRLYQPQASLSLD